MSFYHPTKTFDLTGKVLVVPIVSVANVSQLAVDLLVASLSLERIGLFDTKYLIPAVGAREDGQAGITTSLELYGKNGMDIIVAQQRSPPLKSYKQDFVDALLGFVQESGVAAALFLGGVDMSNRTDAQML
ncbi:hypothetical protein SERLADRAFT_408018 [Serpula lacrymans var. lacrymans S7.9]|nr:uncharacterized protein SERLADRAFT_408018 [Serpula lacrymans var. lacrymans S7.9]EGO25749.1 hypothetical protein SERLADRAFT_408018 [Serpula lacrymans var. lacrymans S7.9]